MTRSQRWCWIAWLRRWLAPTTVVPATRKHDATGLARVGRWLAASHRIETSSSNNEEGAAGRVAPSCSGVQPRKYAVSSAQTSM
jgi:hypothetical protein